MLLSFCFCFGGGGYDVMAIVMTQVKENYLQKKIFADNVSFGFSISNVNSCKNVLKKKP